VFEAWERGFDVVVQAAAAAAGVGAYEVENAVGLLIIDGSLQTHISFGLPSIELS
jgi:hypothetical protein